MTMMPENDIGCGCPECCRRFFIQRKAREIRNLFVRTLIVAIALFAFEYLVACFAMWAYAH